MKFRRRLLLGAGFVVVLSGLSALVVRTHTFRSFAFAQIQRTLRNTRGLVLEVADFDYNLLLSRFELKEVTLTSIRSVNLPVPVRAQRMVVAIPVWRLLRGSFQGAQIRIDGLSIRWIHRTGGAALKGFGGDAMTAGPDVVVTSGDIYLQDERSGFLLHLPSGRLAAVWNAAKHEYGIAYENTGGHLEWKGLRLTLDKARLKAVHSNRDLAVESLLLVSGESDAEISGVLAGSTGRITALADLNLDVHHLVQVLAPKAAARGHLQARLYATGLVEALQINARLWGEKVFASGIQFHHPVAEAMIDTVSGEVHVRDLSAGLFSGQLMANGRIHLDKRSRSEFTARLVGLDQRLVGRVFGSSNVPAGRAAIEATASWPGSDWQRAAISGVARSRDARVAFNANCGPSSIRGTFNATLGGAGGMQGDIEFRLANQALAGALRGRISSLSRLGAHVEGSAEWLAKLGGTMRSPSASLQIEAKKLSIGVWKDADLRVEAEYSAERIGIGLARLVWRGQQIEVKGEIGGLSADARLRLDGTVEGRSLTITPHLETDVSGNLRIQGTVGNPEAEATLRSGGLRVFGERFTRASLDARWCDGELTISRLAAEQLHKSEAPGHLEASGALNVQTGQYTIDAAGKNLRPEAVVLPGGLPLTGAFQVEVHGKGAFNDPVFSAQMAGSDVRVGTMALGEVRAQVDAARHRATALLAAPALNAEATSTIAMDGAWPYEVILNSQNTRLDTTPASSFDATIRANGTLVQPHVERAAIDIHNFRMATPVQEISSDGPIELSYANGQIQVERIALKSGSSVLRLSGNMPFQDEGTKGSLSLEGRVHLEPLAQLFPNANAIQTGGYADVSAAITGSMQSWQPSGSMTIHEGRLHWQPVPFPFENVTGRLNLDDGVIRFEKIAGKAGTGTVQIDGSIPLRLGAPSAARFSAQLNHIELSRRSGEQTATATFDAKVAGEATALSLAALRATVDFTRLEANTKNGRLQQTAPTRITIADAVAHLERFDLKGPNSSLRASGSIGLTGEFPLKLQAAGQTDLAPLAAWAAPLEAAGTARLDVQVGGTLRAPLTTGFVELNQASLAFPNPGLQAGNVKLRADLDGDGVTLKELSGTLNGGAFSGGGDLKFGDGAIRDVNLFLKAKDTFAEYPANVKTTSSLDLKLVSRKERLVLEGQVDIQDGFYDSAIDIFSLSSRNNDAEFRGATGSTSRPLELDLRITTTRPVEMDNNLGRLSATADLRLAGTVKQPRLQGAIALEEDGKIYFGDRVYYVERGSARFLDASRITPELNIQAYTRTGDYTVRLGLTGVPGEITSTFTSDPPLSRDDVIAVLLTGKTVAENRGVDLRALEATSLATGAMNASLSSRLNRAVGVSRVSVQPAAIAAESTHPGARITITQDFTRTLRLLYSMNLSDSNDQVWIGEYDLSRRFTTRAVKQSDNTYRGEFRHDVRFGQSTVSEGTAIKTAQRKISSVQFLGANSFSPGSLAKAFKVKPGQRYQSMKIRKGSERLSKFLRKKGYLESRLHLDRDENGQTMRLTVRIDLGPKVQMAFHGANIPRRQKARLSKLWHSAISDHQRPRAARNAILAYFADKGYLRAEADLKVFTAGGSKQVLFYLKPGPKYSGVEIHIEGAAQNRAKEVRAFVHKSKLKPSLYREPGPVVEAVTRYYQRLGYLSAKVALPRMELNDTRRTGRIVIPLQEGPLFRVGAVKFSGNKALTDAELRTGIPLQAGVSYELARLQPTVASLMLKYGKLGYRDARIEPAIERRDDGALVDVSFTVVENKQTSIRTIAVKGTRQTSAKFVRSQLQIKEGEVANTELVRGSVKNLSQTGAFASADIVVKPREVTANQVQAADVVVAVAEPKPYRLLYGGLYDSGNGPGFIVDLQNHNTLGAGLVLGVRARIDHATDDARIYVTRPFWRQHRLSTTIATYYTRETEYHQTTPTEKLGVSIQQDLQFQSKYLLSYGYRLEKQRGFVPDPAAPDVTATVVRLSPMTLTVSRDARDSFLDATRGSFISHSFELAPHFLGSEYPYARYFLQYSKYFPITQPRPVPFGEKPQRSRLVLAHGIRTGVQKGFNEQGAVLTDRFYAGGGTTVRGFGQDELGPKLANGQPAGGNAVLILNQELRYPLFWIFDAVTFVDIGNVFPRVSDFKLSELRSAGGFGLRLRNPFVVLRFDYGFKFDRRPGEKVGAFFFSIGQAF